jgi:hypothetical protein
MPDEETRWLARLTPLRGGTVAGILDQPLGLDIWERQGEALVVAASEAQLAELERRRLAAVERLETVAAWRERAARHPLP